MKNHGWIFDKPGQFEGENNQAHRDRYGYYKDKVAANFRGRLSTDIGNQDLLIPSHVDVEVVLTPALRNFTLLQFAENPAVEYKFTLLNARLHVRKVKLFPEAIAAFEKKKI